MKRLTIITVLLLVWSIGVVPAGGQENVPLEPKLLYTFMVDHYLECKLAKCHGLSSQLPVIREEAQLALDKVAFCFKNRDELIQSLADEQIEPKQYKVELFINRKFRENREQQVTAKK